MSEGATDIVESLPGMTGRGCGPKDLGRLTGPKSPLPILPPPAFVFERQCQRFVQLAECAVLAKTHPLDDEGDMSVDGVERSPDDRKP